MITRGNYIVHHRDNGQRNAQQLQKQSLWDKVWKDRTGQIVLFQMPNVWIIAWVILRIISAAVASQPIANVTWAASAAILTIWALLEIVQGANYFRRALGLIVLLITVASIFKISL